MKINSAYKYRIYPTAQQEVLLAKHFGCVRFIWNYFLNERKNHYLNNKEEIEAKRIKGALNYFDNAKHLTLLKQDEKYNWLKEVNSQSLQSCLKNLDSAYKMFFRKTHKFPRFKNKFDKQSFTIPQNLKLEDNKLFIPKFSNYIKIKVHRKFEGEFVVATISKNNLNQYFVSIITEKEITIPSQVDGNIGIDLGIKDFATLSNGKKIKNPKILKRNLKKIKFLQRQLSKAKKTSNSRNKRKLKLAKYHQKIANIRNDFLHKITNSISNENQIVVLEDLAVRNMMKNHKLAQAISDVSWYQFKRQLDYKCKWKGRSLIVIDRFFPSSKLCSCCKAIKQDLTLDIREWTCDSCDTIHDRDINASINILNQGLKIADGIAVKSEGSCLQ